MCDFDNILQFVKGKFQEKLKKESIGKTMSATVKWGNNILIKLIPLVLKNVIIKISYAEIRKYTTTTFSNVGRINVLPEYKKYINKFLFLLAPEPVEKIKCSACSYDNKLAFTFTSILQDTSIERAFFNHFEQQGMAVEIESNGVVQ